MLDKLVIHLKNIIFFKSIIYLICIILLGALIPNFQEGLLKTLQKKGKAQSFLTQAQIALNSIVSFEEKITETNLKYKDLRINSGKQGCRDRTTLLQNLTLLSKKHNLYEPISAQISRLFGSSFVHTKSSEVKFHDYQIIINFAVNSPEEVLAVTEDICNTLPSGSLLISTEIKKIETLTPEIIDKLSSKGLPGLIDVSIKVLMREIVYEK